MATLHGILAELGIEKPMMHLKWDLAYDDANWIVDEAFVPVEGRSYEVVYGKILFNGEHTGVVRRLRIDGPHPDQWFDLDEGNPLDRELQDFAVKAFRPIA